MSTASPARPRNEADIDLVCLRMTYDALVPRGVSTTAAAGATAWVLSTEVPVPRLLAWFGVIFCFGVSRVVLSRWIKSRPRSDDELRSFLPLVATLGVLPGAVWGSLIFVCGLSSSMFVITTILLAIGGMTAAGVANSAATPRLFRLTAALSLGPICVHLLVSGESAHRAALVMVLGYVFSILGAVKGNSRELRESIALRFANEDLLERLVAEKERERLARKEADDANREKSRFVAAASHDVRQPLHALGLFVDTLKSQPLDGTARKLVSSIEQAHASLVSVHEGLLEISMIDGGSTTPRPRPVRLRELFERIVNEAAPRARTKGLEVSWSGFDGVVVTDPDLMMRVLRNLVSNAVTYTEKGRVLLSARKRGGRALIQVWDTGLGIPEDQLDLIFRELHQVANAARDREKGLGLGLAIVERLGRLLGFEVKVRSTLGRGSVFSFTLPLSDAAGEVQGPLDEPTEPAKPLKVPAGSVALVIDDDGLARAALASMLGVWGYEVVAATSAEEAREYVSELERLDLVVSDLWLPGTSGLEFLRALDRPATKRVLMSGDTNPDTAERARAAGLVFLRKPVRSSLLQAALGATT